MRFVFFVFLAVSVAAVAVFAAPDFIRVSQSASPPTVNTVVAAATSGGSESALNLVEFSTATLYVHGTITDADGCEDVATNGSVSGKFYRSNHPNGQNCSADNNDCYAIVNADCIKTGCTGPGDLVFDFECTAAIKYWADSTASGPYAGTDWTARITAMDAAQTSGFNADTIEINTLIAVGVPSSLSYGTDLPLGTETSDQVFEIINSGNSRVDVDLSVNSDMICTGLGSAALPAGNARYAASLGVLWTDALPLTTATTEFELDLTPRSDEANPSSKNLFFKLRVPTLGVSGTCANTLTITAKADIEGGW